MYLSKRGIAVAVLLAGCSSEIGVVPPAPGGESGNLDPNVETDDGAQNQDPDPPSMPTETVNPDGTVTITHPDGSTETLDEDGTVIATTPPTQPDADPDAPGMEGEEPGVEPDPTLPPLPDSNCEPGTPQSTQLPRLTNRQYDNTVRDLINVDLQLSATTLQADSKGNMDARSWQSYQDAALTIATTIISNADARAQVVTCTTQDAACAHEIIVNFGAKVFRRPLTDAETQRYDALFADTTLSATGSFDEQLEVVLQALFQSPHFLTIAELEEAAVEGAAGAQRFALSDYELAARLSYMLWDTKPDQILTDAAAAGSLSTGNGLAEQAARMVQDGRAKGLVQRLHMAYMHMGENTRWVGYTRDEDKYPHYNASQIGAIAEETLRVADAVVFSGGSFADLLTTTKAFVNADTASLYNLDPALFGAELTEVQLDASRPGLLTRAGFLAANSYGDRTSPIHRGAFIMKDVLCTDLGDPNPAGVTAELPAGDGLVTNRQRTDAQTAIAADCIACHETRINPPGFALEGFDAVGGVQTMDNGVAVDTVADVLIGGQTVHVTGAVDLMAAIARAPAAQRCYSENWVNVAYNRVLSKQDSCTVDQIARKMADADYSVVNLITDLATVENFRYRALETTEVSQ